MSLHIRNDDDNAAVDCVLKQLPLRITENTSDSFVWREKESNAHITGADQNKDETRFNSHVMFLSLSAENPALKSAGSDFSSTLLDRETLHSKRRCWRCTPSASWRKQS